MVLSGAHDASLVVLSIVIAMFASFTALSLAARIRASSGGMRRLWIVAAAVALGGGIWSMHFIAMLAFSIPGMTATYDVALTFVSLAIAVSFTGVGFTVLSGKGATLVRIVPAGCLMGLGVLAMHYLGMAAMRMPAALSYGRSWLAASVLIAIGAAVAAVWLAARDQKPTHQLLAAGVMGIAIAGMHYAGMRAAIFTAAGSADMAAGRAGVGQEYLAILVGVITMTILLMALGAARLERMFRESARREARAALRVKVSDVLRGQDVNEALQEVAGLMGVYFGVSRTGYGRLDLVEDAFEYDICWTDGAVPPLLGRFPAAAFGAKIVASLHAGKTVVIDDLLKAELSDEAATRETARDVDTRAILVVPFLRGGKLRAIVYLNDQAPRAWRAQDAAFMEEIAERTRQVIERVAVEDELRELNATLEERIAAEVDARMQTEEALRQSQKVEAIGQLTGGVAHDFNNLLTVIRGSVDLLRRPDVPEDRQRRYIDAIADTADRAAKLTGQLLAFARRQALTPETFDVAANLAAIRDMIASLVGSRISITLEVADEPCFINADAAQFDTAIVNMAVNARDAMNGAGEIALAVGTGTLIPAARSHPEVEGNFVTVSVSDHGDGISPDDLARIFEPFYTTKGVGEGTGLGLSQVIGFAKQSGGDVLVDSVVGEGSTFTLFLPRVEAVTSDPTAEDFGTEPRGGQGACVLVVEDNLDVGRFATATLADLGYSTVYAASADAAIAQLDLDAERFDVVFSDVVMPGMSGLEFARLVNDRHPSLPIVLTSGYSHVLAAEGSSGFALLHKPYSTAELSRVLSQAMRNAAAHNIVITEEGG